MDPKFLLDEELHYELAVRKLRISERRDSDEKRLSEALVKEARSKKVQILLNLGSAQEELDRCHQNVTEIIEFGRALKGPEASIKRKELVFRLMHYQGILERISESDQEIRDVRDDQCRVINQLITEWDIVDELPNNIDQETPGTSQINGQNESAQNNPPCNNNPHMNFKFKKLLKLILHQLPFMLKLLVKILPLK
jgi:hypothetical protein